MRNSKLAHVETSRKSVLRHIICGYSTCLIVVLLISDSLVPCAAIKLCGGIRNKFVCDDQDPAVFHICIGNNQYSMLCPGKLHFNARTQNCDWPKSANCVEEARSKQAADAFSAKITQSPTSIASLNQHGGSSSLKVPSSTSNSLSISTKFESDSTEHGIAATVIPISESTSFDEPISRYKLKVVPGTDKPIESLLTADEKVLEEVKKLSEELKHVDNYLQTLEPDQVGFIIEPYKGAVPRRRYTYENRYPIKTSRKRTIPSFSPYRKKITSKSPMKKTTSFSPFTKKTEKYRTPIHESKHVSDRASIDKNTQSPYTPIHESKDVSDKASIDKNTQSPYTPIHESKDVSDKASIDKNTQSPYTPIHESKHVSDKASIDKNTQSPYTPIHESKHVSDRASTEQRTRSPYKQTKTLYHEIYIPTTYRRQSVSDLSPGYSNKLLHTKFESNLIRHEGDSLQENEAKSMISGPVANSNSSALTSFNNEISPGTRAWSPHITSKAYTIPHSAANSILTSNSSWNQKLHRTQKSNGKIDASSQHANRNIFQQPIKYSAVDSRMTKSRSHWFGEKTDNAKNKHESITSRKSSRSAAWWSTERSNPSFTSPFSRRVSNSGPMITPVKYTYITSASTTQENENLSNSNAVTVTSGKVPWWSSTYSDNKYTNTPDVTNHIHRRKFKPRDNISKPNYNTRTDDELLPDTKKSISYKSLSNQNKQGEQQINAQAALGRNLVFNNSARSPVTEDGSISLHQVNAPASFDKITLHKSFDNKLNKVEAAAQIDKVFALHKSDENTNIKEKSTGKSPIENYDYKKVACSTSWCQLPDCRCIGSDIPGDLDVKDVPQMVMLTFDDSINSQNMHYFRGIFNGTLKNPNGCPIKSTFFVSGDNSDYDMVKRIYKQGHEIASHTISHRNPTTWWAHAGFDNWEQEIGGMRDRLQEKSGVPIKEITGMRAPFLQVDFFGDPCGLSLEATQLRAMSGTLDRRCAASLRVTEYIWETEYSEVGGDAQYAMLKENKFRYDSSMVTGNLYSNSRAPIWPFTLDTPPDSGTCSLTPCPTRSYPGLWEIPLIRWYGSNNVACAMPDACTIGFGSTGTRKFMEENFNRHYTTNRAPLGIFIHASWFGRKDGNFQGLIEFLASLAEKGDVWIVSMNQSLDWIQHPVRLSDLGALKSWNCLNGLKN